MQHICDMHDVNIYDSTSTFQKVIYRVESMMSTLTHIFGTVRKKVEEGWNALRAQIDKKYDQIYNIVCPSPTTLVYSNMPLPNLGALQYS